MGPKSTVGHECELFNYIQLLRLDSEPKTFQKTSKSKLIPSGPWKTGCPWMPSPISLYTLERPRSQQGVKATGEPHPHIPEV